MNWTEEDLAAYERRFRSAGHGQVTRARKEYVRAVAQTMQPKPSKYRNKPCVVDSIRFASQAEARRYQELKLLEQSGRISDLKLQPRFPLIVQGKTICTYVGDFYYREWFTGIGEKVEDVKGVETAAFKIKAALFRILHPQIELRVVRA